MSSNRDELIELGTAALAGGDYFAAHEHWEDAWRLTDGAEKPVVQALAQLAAALVHVTRGNAVGAMRVLDKARIKLDAGDAPSVVGSIVVSRVREVIAELRAGLRSGAVAVDLEAICRTLSREA